MQTFSVQMTGNAEDDLDRILHYLLYVKKSSQAAESVFKDFQETKIKLETVAGILKLMDNPVLAKEGYKKIGFQRHRYYLLFRIEGTAAIVDGIFDELQDTDGILR